MQYVPEHTRIRRVIREGNRMHSMMTTHTSDMAVAGFHSLESAPGFLAPAAGAAAARAALASAAEGLRGGRSLGMVFCARTTQTHVHTAHTHAVGPVLWKWT